MITLNKRQNELLKVLDKKEDYVTIGYLSKELKCSERTIRNDLTSIETFIEEQNGVLERKPRVGIKLNLNSSAHLEDLMKESTVNIYSSEIRKMMIISILIIKGKLTTEKLSNEMFISKNTIANDLKEIDKVLERYEIEISKKVYHGMMVSANEEKIRSTFLNIYLKLEDNLKKDIKNRLIAESGLNSLNVQYQIIQLENLLKTRYSQESIEAFEIMILLSKCREKNGFSIKNNQNKERFETKFLKDKIPLGLDEIGYLITISDGLPRMVGGEESKVTEEILKEISKILNIDCTNDLDFEKRIGIHLKAAIHRIKNNFVIENPMLDEIKLKMSFIFKITKEILKTKEEALGVEFPEAEIAYMAMYLDAIFEKNVKDKFDYKILVVCNGGLATSSLLKTRLNIMVPEAKIVSICRLRDVQEKIKNEVVDFIVTTVPLKIKGYKVIKVNPLLDYGDAEKIKAEIYNKRYEKNCRYLSGKVKDTNKETISGLIKEEFSIFESEILNWKEAIEEAAKPLVKRGKIKEDYSNEIIEVINNLGNYMVFIPEIAFVHATPENVVENSIGILNLKHKIQFGVKNTVLVKTIVLIANKEENMNLVNLINIITKDNNIDRFKNAKSYEELKGII